MAPTNGQIRKIWASAREIGLEEPQLRDQVEELTGSRSISQMSFEQAHTLIELLVAAGATSGGGRRKPSGRPTAPNEIKLVTGDQRELIEELRQDIGGDWTRDEYFAGACKRVIKRTHPRTGAEAARVIEMLKQRRNYERSKAGDG